MLSISPGNSPVFAASLEPHPTFAPDPNSMSWAASSSDGAPDIQIVPNDMSATLVIPQDITVGSVITIQGTYLNPDGSYAVGVGNFTVV